MDDGRAASAAVMAASGAHQVAGSLTVGTITSNAPARHPFLCYFLLGAQKKVDKKNKISY